MPRRKRKRVKYRIKYPKVTWIQKFLVKFRVVRLILKLKNAIKRRRWLKRIEKICIKLWITMNEKRYRASGKITLDKLNSLIYMTRNKAPAPISELRITYVELYKTYEKLKQESRSKKHDSH